MKILNLYSYLLLLVTTSPIIINASKVSYAGYKVYRVHDLPTNFPSPFPLPFPTIELQRRLESIDIAIPPEHVPLLSSTTTTTWEILSEDLGVDIDLESTTHITKYVKEEEGELPSLSWFNTYHDYADHVEYWKDLQLAFPNNSELFSVGKSFEGRDIQGIHLWGKEEGGGKKKRKNKEVILFHGNVHAREWITSMVVEYILYQLINGYNNEDELVVKILDNYDFYILPIVNPDGFIYTQTTDRLWRKNRQVRKNTTTTSIGTDINRNWQIGFGGPGSSMNPSSETFSGFEPHDTPETFALATFVVDEILSRQDRKIKLYVDWHSYAQTILLSYGYVCDEFPHNIEDQENLARGMAEAIADVYNTTFIHGPGCKVLYQSSGNGRDYLTDVGKAEFGWGVELRDTKFGFLLPAEQILPSGVEVWEGLRYVWTQF
ncbi:hypothetical protein GGS20DRAFT_219614 [Poronia punctata]|nr:hypothetical protein GGS20DRAFT_219614 [Poronia punctata]